MNYNVLVLYKSLIRYVFYNKYNIIIIRIEISYIKAITNVSRGRFYEDVTEENERKN